MIKIDFEFQTEHGLFRDALHLPDNHGLTDVQIETIKEQRRDNWITVVTAPPAGEEVMQEQVNG